MTIYGLTLAIQDGGTGESQLLRDIASVAHFNDLTAETFLQTWVEVEAVRCDNDDLPPETWRVDYFGPVVGDARAFVVSAHVAYFGPTVVAGLIYEGQ